MDAFTNTANGGYMNFHPTDFMSDQERSQHLKDIMAMNERIWKNAPRVVYDHKNDNINIVCGKKKVWNDD